jgi:hypothetical protein
MAHHTERTKIRISFATRLFGVIPSKTKGIKFGNYSNSEGFIPENTLVENRDIIKKSSRRTGTIPPNL